MPYGLIVLLVAIALTARFVVASHASPRAKSAVAVAGGIAIIAPLAFPQWHLVGLLAQVVLVIGLVLHGKVHAKRSSAVPTRPDRRARDPNA